MIKIVSMKREVCVIDKNITWGGIPMRLEMELLVCHISRVGQQGPTC